MTDSPSCEMSRSQFRAMIRERRQQLSSEQQSLFADSLVSTLTGLKEWQQAHTIALYLSFDGEIDTQPLIRWCWENGKTICMPVLHPFSKGQLLFLRYHPNSQMVTNQYGVLEPKLRQSDIVPVASIDIIATPLVGFDASGQRLGMGGGYYDRTLAPFEHLSSAPLAIGLAHHCQFVDKLPTEQWDVPLPLIATPDKIWRW